MNESTLQRFEEFLASIPLEKYREELLTVKTVETGGARNRGVDAGRTPRHRRLGRLAGPDSRLGVGSVSHGPILCPLHRARAYAPNTSRFSCSRASSDRVSLPRATSAQKVAS